MSDPEFILLGDAVWLDFVNTAGGRDSTPVDRLPDSAAYHRWAKAEKLTSDAGSIPFADALELRSRLADLARALAAGRQAPASAIERVNSILARTEGHFQLTRTRGRWYARFTPSAPPSASSAIARSVVATLTHPSRRVRQCSAPACSLFFTEDPPEQIRNWCSMEYCGERNRTERRRSLR